MKGKKLWRLAAGIILATLVVGMGCMYRSEPEPAYQGKPLSYWLKKLGKEPGGVVDMQSEAAIAVQTIGTNALPTLFHLLEARQNRWTEKVNGYIKRLPGVKFRIETADFKHYRAFKGFVALGSLGSAAVPDLLRIYTRIPKDLSQRNDVCGLFGAMGSAAEMAVPSIIVNLANEPDARSRNFAACALGHMRAGSEIAIPGLIAALHDSDDGVRFSVVLALARFDACPESVIPALMAALGDSNYFIHTTVADVLATFGASARAALPVFKQVLVDLEEPDFSPLWKFYYLLESVATRPPSSLGLTILPDIDLPN